VVDGFAPGARGLRAHFDERFGAPRAATRDRFVWDLWHVEGQYTALRTPAWEFFPKRAYDAFHQRLAWWGRRVLGCHDVSPPWLSCYVNGCEQRLHGDLPHGQFAFVFSLTNWAGRSFRGGETLILRDGVLDFWRGFRSVRASEEPELVEAIAPRFNRLVVFDPRLPHAVRRVEGSMDPLAGRLVIHGWFLQPRPFIEGPLSPKQLGGCIDALTGVIAPFVQEGLPVAGLASFGFRVGADGRVGKVTLLADTTRVPSGDERRLATMRRAVRARLAAFRFGKQRGGSRVTLPLVFER
jgi:hypothetical protein